MIRALIFDCFGVVVSRTWPAFCERHFRGDDVRWYVASDLNRARDAGFLSEQEYYGELAMLAGIEPQQVRAELHDGIVVNEALMHVIESYKPTHKISMLSNVAGRQRLEEIFRPEQLAVFDELILSGDIGIVKPEPRIYELAAERLGMLPEECAFIDDSESHVIGARAVGMTAELYTDTAHIAHWLAEKTQQA